MSVNSFKEGPREAQKLATRARILTQAAALCARNGFARTRTIDVARAAGVSHGSVFVHFPSREELIDAVVGEMTRAITDALHARVSTGGTIGDVLAAHVECLTEFEDQIRWLVLEAPVAPDGFRLAWLGMQSAISSHITQAAEREMVAGRIKTMPLHLLFNTWIGLLHHYVINRDVYAPGRSVLREQGPALLEHFMALVSEPTQPKATEKSS